MHNKYGALLEFLRKIFIPWLVKMMPQFFNTQRTKKALDPKFGSATRIAWAICTLSTVYITKRTRIVSRHTK